MPSSLCFFPFIIQVSMRPWPILTEIALVLYALALGLYLSWPITLINIDLSIHPVLGFFVFLSIIKWCIPLIGIFLAVMHVNYADLLGLFVGVIVAALIDSFIIVIILFYHLIRANSSSGYQSFGNDLLYCCKYFGQVAQCPDTYGPCENFSGKLRIHEDLIVLLSFQGILMVLEVICVVLMTVLYKTHGGSTTNLSIPSTQALMKAPMETYQKLSQNFTTIVYGFPKNKQD